MIVSNLNKEFTNSELKKLFDEYGRLTRCGIRYNKMGESTGVAFIEFSAHEEAQKAIEKTNNSNVGGVEISVRYARNRGTYFPRRRLSIRSSEVLRRRRPLSQRVRRPLRYGSRRLDRDEIRDRERLIRGIRIRRRRGERSSRERVSRNRDHIRNRDRDDRRRRSMRPMRSIRRRVFKNSLGRRPRRN